MHVVDTICKDVHMDVVSRRLPDGSCIDVACPLTVKLYNQNMGGVDLADQMRNHMHAHVDQELGGTCDCSGFGYHKCVHSGICKPKPCPTYS